ncbi:Fur family transcriptional regulator [Demequina sp. NBRC 110057]|uniref:Fur family transcriptional regulator n=1 Tax=Demequina sp. NBRC 110057 TaxID=1570346 RepID=UPI000A000509|nr:Fur family transcriptional regulator [Demequina sp. NBRC 110057]
METTATTEPIALLRGAGLRVTDSRVAVIAALDERPHSGVDTVLTAVATVLPSTSRQAVHNVLNDLTEAGIARRIEPAGQPGLYELRVGDNHHHIVCQRCGAVADVDCVTGHAPCLTPSTTSGFDLSEAEVTFWGVCSACKASQADAGETTP